MGPIHGVAIALASSGVERCLRRGRTHGAAKECIDRDVREWLDRIALDIAEGRAYVLENPGLLGTNRPRNETEELFFDAAKMAVKEADALSVERRKRQ